MKATIIQNISNQYKVVDEEDNVHICTARGKLKNNNQVLNKREENVLKLASNYGKINTLTPVAGDKVEIENEAITKIYERINFIKRPKIANVTQVVFVLSLKEPEPDILMLDKQLAFAENMGLKSIIVLNKCDLADSGNLKNIYEKVGYPVLEWAGAWRRSRIFSCQASLVLCAAGAGTISRTVSTPPATEKRMS